MSSSVYFRSSSNPASSDEGEDIAAEDLASFSSLSLLPSLKSTRAALRAELLDPFVAFLAALLYLMYLVATTGCTLSMRILVSFWT